MKLINALGFNIIWLGCVSYGDNFLPYIVLLLVLHFCFIEHLKTELYLVFSIALAGIFIDSLLTKFDVFNFELFKSEPQLSLPFLNLPLWLMALWFAFAATVNHSLAFLKQYFWLRIFTGSIAIPLSYFAGYQLDVVQYSSSVLSTLCVLSLTWTVFMVFVFPYLINRTSNSVHQPINKVE